MTRQTAALGLRLVAAFLAFALSATVPATARDAARGGAVVQVAAEGGHSYRRDRGHDAGERGRHHRRDAGDRRSDRGRDGASQAPRGFEGGHSYRRDDRHDRRFRREDRRDHHSYGKTHRRGDRHERRHDRGARGVPSIIRKVNPWQ